MRGSASNMTFGAQYQVKMWELLFQRTKTIKAPTWAVPGRGPPEPGTSAPVHLCRCTRGLGLPGWRPGCCSEL